MCHTHTSYTQTLQSASLPLATFWDTRKKKKASTGWLQPPLCAAGERRTPSPRAAPPPSSVGVASGSATWVSWGHKGTSRGRDRCHLGPLRGRFREPGAWPVLRLLVSSLFLWLFSALGSVSCLLFFWPDLPVTFSLRDNGLPQAWGFQRPLEVPILQAPTVITRPPRGPRPSNPTDQVFFLEAWHRKTQGEMSVWGTVLRGFFCPWIT